MGIEALDVQVPKPPVTVTLAVPLCPSLVAVIVGDPAATPVTSPLALTVAAAVLPLVQVTARPVSTLPAASFVVAVSCTVPPGPIVAVVGVTITEATGATRFTRTVVETGPKQSLPEDEPDRVPPAFVIVTEPVAVPSHGAAPVTVKASNAPLMVALIVPVATTLPESAS